MQMKNIFLGGLVVFGVRTMTSSIVPTSIAAETERETSITSTSSIEDENDATGIEGSKKGYDYYQANSETTSIDRIDDGIIVENVDDAIEYLYDSGLTRFSSRAEFMHEQGLRRDEAAAFFVRFVRDVLGKNTSDVGGDEYGFSSSPEDHCLFSDLDQAHNDLREEIQESCRLGLFKGHAGKFMPTDEFSNAHAMTVMIRLIEGMQEEPEENWAREYFVRARRAGLVQSLEGEQEVNLYRPITRGDVAKMIEGSAVYIASRNNLSCPQIDPLDPDDDGDGIPTLAERCIVQGPLRRVQGKAQVCDTGSDDCDDTDADIHPGRDRSAVKELDKASPYIMTELAMPCDGATCPDGSCVATPDECIGVIDNDDIVFVTSAGDDLWCRGRDGVRERCEGESIELITSRAFSDTYRKYLTTELTSRLSLPGVDDAIYSLREGMLLGADGQTRIVVLVEPSERSLAAQANTEYDVDDTELVPACITPSGQGDCPENKTCSDGSTVDCTCNTGICLCKMCGESSTLTIK